VDEGYQLSGPTIQGDRWRPSPRKKKNVFLFKPPTRGCDFPARFVLSPFLVTRGPVRPEWDPCSCPDLPRGAGPSPPLPQSRSVLEGGKSWPLRWGMCAHRRWCPPRNLRGVDRPKRLQTTKQIKNEEENNKKKQQKKQTRKQKNKNKKNKKTTKHKIKRTKKQNRVFFCFPRWGMGPEKSPGKNRQ